VDETVGKLKSRTVVSVALSPAARADVALAFCVALAESVDPGGGHICFGQATTGLRTTPLLGAPAWRIRTTASAVISTVGKITAQIWNFRFG